MDKLIRFILILLLLSVGEDAVAQVSCGILSSCPFASLPLSGGELLWVTQGGISKKTTVGNLTSLQGYTIATLPTCNASFAGIKGFVTNGQSSPSFLGTVSTTGSTVAPVFCNGSSWVYG